jgi:hypothetical protein
MTRPWTEADLIRLKRTVRPLGRRVGSVKAKVREMGLVPLKKSLLQAIRRLVEPGLRGKK